MKSSRYARLMLPLLLAACGGSPLDRADIRPAQADGFPLGTLPQQSLREGQCGLFLWKTPPSPRLILMANSGPPAFARVMLDGRLRDLHRIGDAGDALTTASSASYSDGEVTIALDLVVEERRGLTAGAVSSGSLSFTRTGGDALVIPVSGLLGCR